MTDKIKYPRVAARIMEKQKWIEEVYKLLCKSQGEPENPTHAQHLLEWAETLYNSALEDADGNASVMLSPQAAHDEELSCA